MPRAWVQFLVGELDPTSHMAQPKHKTSKPTLVPELGGQYRPADQTRKVGPSWGQPHSDGVKSWLKPRLGQEATVSLGVGWGWMCCGNRSKHGCFQICNPMDHPATGPMQPGEGRSPAELAYVVGPVDAYSGLLTGNGEMCCTSRSITGTSVVVQWLRIRLPMVGMKVLSWSGGVDPTQGYREASLRNPRARPK